MFFEGFAQSGSWIAGNGARQVFEGIHGMINSAAQIRFRSTGKRLQRFVDFLASCRPAGFLKRRFSSFYGRFKPFRAARDNLALHQLPADAVRRKEVVDGLLKCRRFRLIPDRAVIPSLKSVPDPLDDVVDLKPFTPMDILSGFVPDVRVFTPIARIWSPLENSAGNVSDVTRGGAQITGGFQNALPQIFRRVFPNAYFFRLVCVTVAL